ncbi:MAG: tRNA (guanine(46)-N(7))-methyltransferase TrmB [Candidatus Omnitrophota bacterium]
MSETGNTDDFGSYQYGRWLIQLRRGEMPDIDRGNNYVFEAVDMKHVLYTFPELKETFPNIFENPTQPIVLDVGCYWGHNVVELATHNPGINVLGLDIKFKRVVKSCHKIRRGQLPNAKIALCDVRDVIDLAPERSIYGICIFFPDPWIKSRHQKFRYLIEDFFEAALPKLTDDGFIWLKTDHPEYYDAVLEFGLKHRCDVEREPGVGEQLSVKLASREYRTIFESLFLKQNLPVYRLMLKKQALKD